MSRSPASRPIWTRRPGSCCGSSTDTFSRSRCCCCFAAASAVTYLILPATRQPGRPRLPVAASLLASAGMFAILYALIQGAQVDWGRVAGPVGALPLLVAGVLAMVAFVLWERARGDGLL